MILIKVVIAGSRGFQDYEMMKRVLDKELQMYNPSEIEIASGGADGADKLGERYQIEEGLARLTQFIPKWDAGDAAGHKRNAEMAAYGDWVFCFWDGKSRGTKSMIKMSERAGKKVFVIKY